jgi:ATP-dependent DNA helicase DinG
MTDREEQLTEVLNSVVRAMGGEPREGQERMVRAIGAAFDGARHVVIQAGTGTGKSLAYLIPAARMARDHGPVVIATATLALQRQLLERELPRLAHAGTDFQDIQWAVLKGRHNYLCKQRLGEADEAQSVLAFDDPGAQRRGTLEEQARAVHEWSTRTDTGDRDDLDMEVDARIWRAVSVTSAECVGESRCAFGEECFAARARLRASEADIVVTNHAMLAIDAIGGIPVLPERSALIIDEAHELVDRVTSAVTSELTVSVLERLVGECARLVDDQGSLADAVDELAIAMMELIDSGMSARVTAWSDAMVLALTRLRDAARGMVSGLSTVAATAGDQAPAVQRVRAGVEEVFATSGRALALSSTDVVWCSAEGGRSPALRIAPLHVGDQLAESLFVQQPVALTSATLVTSGSFDALVASLGLAPDTECHDVGAGFDFARQGILYVAAHLPPPDRDGVSMEALDELADLIEAAGGRSLVLLSSWRGVDRASDYLRVRLGPAIESGRVGELLVQRRGESVRPLIERFAAEPASVLVGTVSLWQGIDVPGDSLTLVVIDRIPFPRPDDPVMSARSDAVDRDGGSGFRQVALARAALLLAQGAGRLIRSAEDRGVVAVLDSRMVTAGYGSALRASLPPLWFTTDREVVRASLRNLTGVD